MNVFSSVQISLLQVIHKNWQASCHQFTKFSCELRSLLSKIGVVSKVVEVSSIKFCWEIIFCSFVWWLCRLQDWDCVSIECLDCDDSTSSRFEVLWVGFLELKFIGFVESLLQEPRWVIQGSLTFSSSWLLRQILICWFPSCGKSCFLFSQLLCTCPASWQYL